MSQLRPAIFLLLLLTVVCGVVYPLLTTGLAQWLFPWQANGSLLKVEGEERGSALIGQAFSQPGEFWGRPSATGDKPYNPWHPVAVTWPRVIRHSTKRWLNALPRYVQPIRRPMGRCRWIW